MTSEQRAALAALVERITPGRYFMNAPEPDGNCLSRLLLGQDAAICTVLYDDEDDAGADANAEFIAFCFTHAREIAEALGERERIVAWLRSYADCCRAEEMPQAEICIKAVANAIEADSHNQGDL